MGIELTEEEIEQYMLQAPRMIVSISRGSRAPLSVPMWFWWKEREIFLDTLLASPKVALLRKNPNVCCLVESGEQYFSLKAVRFTGVCTIIEDQQEVRQWREQLDEAKPLYRSLFPPELPPHLERLYHQPRALLHIKPDHAKSWDFAKVRR